ncbi:Poly(A) RNA polymerase cid13 [Metarhizium album ARSEF 1941]|uniref:polynucleotide adenylyltransferase n=1 Tax=Metarhizium album (strain ARSEF 1941) TaxID=1081103 RepID=A0A0B2X0D7_METAS|nr:Poly(A) RNA polymerase cid13 [Metarhizium album ARSEF 1941]KHN99294.1 Poly(A) RNA polymerase cid13 [Metarhizium album ARSEF 1941]
MEDYRNEGPQGLEDRLRGLILVNQVSPSTGSDRGPDMSSLASEKTSGTPSYSRSVPSSERVSKTSPAPGARNDIQPSRTGRRRPNQAQRRQMSSELSIALSSQWQSLNQNSVLPAASYNSPSFHRPGVDGGIYSLSATSGLRQPEPAIRPEPRPRNTEVNNCTTPQFSGSSEFCRSQADRSQMSSWHQQSFPPQSPRNIQAQHHISRRQYFNREDVITQAALLDSLCFQVVRNSEIERDEIAQKESFRQKVERICQETISDFEQNTLGSPHFPSLSVELKCFGSLSSGFATKASDMDLGLFSPFSSMQPDAPGSAIPRMLEKAFLDVGFGARLLSRTRVPIIKLCEKPPEELRHALLLERLKWENGVGNADASEDQEEYEPDSRSNETAGNITMGDHEVKAAPASEFGLPARGDGREYQRLQLKQNSQSSLQSYYALAKRVLRRAGARDVTASNYRELSDMEWATLSEVCQAFVRGLRDAELRRRLESCSSLSFGTPWSATSHRSLSGIYVQAEGEQTCLAWDNWSSKTSICDPNEQVTEAMSAWRDVQHRTDFGTDPLTFNRDLNSAFEKMKRLPLIQLCRLEQDVHEPAAQYHLRAQGIVGSLAKLETNMSDLALKAVALRYITGINDDRLRQDMMSAVQESQHSMGLDELGKKHECLDLAYELEKAVANNLYDDNFVSVIKDYMEVLRTPLVKVTRDQQVARFAIPVTPAVFSLLSSMRQLQDPRKLAVKRPRDRYQDALEFPSGGVGVQCDINFSAHLALQNTLLLRCYSLTDTRVRPMVLFVKRWAKVRGINSGYRGTLGSYGYVLMVLHYLVNIAKPFVCPNLQQLAPSISSPWPRPSNLDMPMCQGYNVEFWSSESEIMHLANSHQLNQNTESIGQLLRGFFEYFAQNGPLSRGFGKGFDWGRDVLSLRTFGGLVTKQEKGWTGAKTVYESQNPMGKGLVNHCREEPSSLKSTCSDSVRPNKPRSWVTSEKGMQGREVRHRYLFAIEDPFELDHNVARTVTHNGIVSIRDEFRRAWRLIRTAGSGGWSEPLLEETSEATNDQQSFIKLVEDIHGPQDQWVQAQP